MNMNHLFHDESGFIVSAELVLVASLLVIGLVVGMSEVQHSVVQELNDVGDALGSLNQSYCYSGFSARKQFVCCPTYKSITRGSYFVDGADECDHNQCAISCDVPVHECRGHDPANCPHILEHHRNEHHKAPIRIDEGAATPTEAAPRNTDPVDSKL